MATATTNEKLSKDETAILGVIEGIHRALHNKDAAGIVAPYAADAVICDLAPPLWHRGMNLQEKQAWLDTWDGPIEMEMQDIQVSVSGDLAICHGFYKMTGTPKMAGREVAFWMRVTKSLRREDGGWRIVHEHTSVPFYMDGSLRPAFDLRP